LVVNISRIISQNQCNDLHRAFSEPLPFKIPIVSLDIVNGYPDTFELGKATYGLALDSWLEYQTSGSSEMAVVSVDSNFLNVIEKSCPGVICYRDEKDASSRMYLRPDVTLYFNSSLFCKIEEKTNPTDLEIAINEFTSKLTPKAHQLFPVGTSRIWGIASAKGLIRTVFISYDVATKEYTATPHSNYNLAGLDGRIEFIVDLMKFLRFVHSVRSPNKYFHLVPHVRRQTSNGHHITWTNDGIIKEFKSLVSNNQLNYISEVYNRKLPHVEWGEIMSINSRVIKITRLGHCLKKAIFDKTITKEAAFEQIQEGVNELHGIGFAHCDLSLNNVFVDIDANVVFLDDLEYLTPVNDIPPHSIRCGDAQPNTAEELDNLQLTSLWIDILRL
jgi:hypothetical protein